MTNGNIATLGRRLAKLENSQWGARADLGDYRAPWIVVREGEDVDQITKGMEARGEIPPPESFPPGHVRVVIWRIVEPIGRRLDRLETEFQRKTDPGHGPVFKLIDNPRGPQNPKRLQEAEQFSRENPNGLIIH